MVPITRVSQDEPFGPIQPLQLWQSVPDIICMPGLILAVHAQSMPGSNTSSMNSVMGSRFGPFLVGSGYLQNTNYR